MARLRQRKCRCCKELYKPDARNVYHQRYCTNPDYRVASKAESRRRWLSKNENRDYFKGPEQVARVRAWRAQHPGYSQRKVPPDTPALQDDSSVQPIDNTDESPSLKNLPLQEHLFAEPAVMAGLIAHLTGLTLQEDIAATRLQLLRLGCQVLSITPPGESYDAQTPHQSAALPSPAQSVQLARPAPDP